MRYLSILVLLVVSLTGCDAYRQVCAPPPPPPEPPLVKRVDSPELAKLILKPKRAQFDVKRDPFQPLITEEEPKDGGNGQASGVNEIAPDFSDCQVVGIVKQDGEYVALIKIKARRGLYRLNDKIKGFVITEIHEDKVIVNTGKKNIPLKRGGQR